MKEERRKRIILCFFAGIAVMVALFLHPLGWRAERVQRLCGPEAEPFYPADCSIGR